MKNWLSFAQAEPKFTYALKNCFQADVQIIHRILCRCGVVGICRNSRRLRKIGVHQTLEDNRDSLHANRKLSESVKATMSVDCQQLPRFSDHYYLEVCFG